jgi:tetratricopeptide (TPR) repeat protein
LAGPNDALFKASSAMKAGMYQEALSHIAIAQKTDKNNADLYRMKALLHEALDESKPALSAWNDCLKYSKDKFLSSEAKIHIQILTIE